MDKIQSATVQNHEKFIEYVDKREQERHEHKGELTSDGKAYYKEEDRFDGNNVKISGNWLDIKTHWKGGLNIATGGERNTGHLNREEMAILRDMLTRELKNN